MPKKVEETRVERTLKVPLLPDEMETHAARSALLEAEQESAELAKKASASQFKDKIDGIILERRRLAAEYRQGFRYAQVQCVVKYDYEIGEVGTVRLDTAEIVDTRLMTPDEKQQKLL